MRALTVTIALLALAAGSASAQTPSEAVRPDGHGMVGEPLESGANSFTEAQVRERFGRMGFGEIRDLKKTDQGIWEGIATHAGKEVRIGMDYRGNVAAR
ncbi:hypothetical protein [Methylobacterium symbioticum]|uniref:PepSY domain-containing protein n=1 Tax=Methylobacterium symbioticum TaxID=2584084 RepID=A0A509E818_9HYPH|nr:hypothetical protein [Methylobacterium symbioticum]VUD70272.1 hypothetical protein MET9862_00836 [Methylobacterium symbioticum]